MKNNPQKSFREVFLAVLGITPQVLTECLYYYYSNYYKHPDQSSVYKTSSNILTFITTNPKYWGEVPKLEEPVPPSELPAIDIPSDSLNSL